MIAFDQPGWNRVASHVRSLARRTEVLIVEFKLLTPFFDLEKEWEQRFRRFPMEGREFGFRPSLDVIEKDGELVVATELPGIDPVKDVEITIEDDVLTIKGEKIDEREVSEDDRYIRERRYGKFIRRIPLPDGVSADKIMAGYDKGVLTVRVALPEEKVAIEPRTIPVEVVAS
ncbi:MAG: Hsp20/alpha crystallin family protein [Acidimicrobiia bacterium]